MSLSMTTPRFSRPATVVAPYPVTPGVDLANKSYVLRGWLLDRTADPERHLAVSILARILSGSLAAPLYKALIESRLGDDVVGWFETDILETFGCVGLKGTDVAKQAAVEQVIDDTLRRLAAGGLDARTIEAAVNATEFRLREANYGGYSKGLIYALQMAASWLYDGDPLVLLKYEVPLAAIKRQAGQGYFQNLIRRYLLDNPHRVTICLQPDPEFENRRLARLKQRLAERQARLTPAALDQVVTACRELREAQLRPDPPEVVATIPKLPLSCLPKQAEVLPLETVSASPALWFSEQPTTGIGYLKLVFDADGLPSDLLPYVPFFCQATLQTGTAKRDYVELTEELDIHTGGLGVGDSATAAYGQPDQVLAQVQCTGKALRAKLPRLLELVTEVLTTARLDHTQRLVELAQIARAGMESSINNHGNFFVACRLGAYLTPVGAHLEQTHGLEQYYFLERLVRDLNTDPASVTARLQQVRDRLFTRENLKVHLTGGRAELAELQRLLPALAAALPSRPAPARRAGPAPLAGNEGFIVPIKVYFVGKALNLYRHGFAYRGTFEVLNKLLSRDYLWNKVRVQGNAYGCFCSFDLLSGTFGCVSYRDPNLEETLAVFDQTADYLANLSLSQDELEKLLIGTMAGVDAPRSPDEKGAVAFRRHLTGISQELIQRHREQLLGCTLADLRGYADILREYRDHGQICVLGGEPKLRAAASRFASVQYALGQPTGGAARA